MSLVGSLEDLGLGDILQIVSLSRKSGVLNLTWENRKGKILFRDGQVVSAITNEMPSRFDTIMVEGGNIVTAEKMIEAVSLKRGIGKGKTLKEILVERLGTDPHAIENRIKEHVEQVVFRLFGWTEGNFNFDLKEGDFEKTELGQDSEGILLAAGLNPQFLAMEGTRLQDEAKRKGFAEPPAKKPAAPPQAAQPKPPAMEHDHEEHPGFSDAFAESHHDAHPAPAQPPKPPPPPQRPPPGTRQPAAQPSAPPQRKPQPQPPKKDAVDKALEEEFKLPQVLVVDDDPEIINLVQERLRGMGLKGEGILKVSDALRRVSELLSKGHCPVLIADLFMPRTDGEGILGGLELVRTIKGRFPFIPIILSSDYPNEAAEKEARSMGLDHYMDKPKRSQIWGDKSSPELSRFSDTLREILPEMISKAVIPKQESIIVPQKSIVSPEEGLFDLGRQIRQEMGEAAAPTGGEETVQTSRGLNLLKTMINELNDPSFSGQITLMILRFAAELMNRAIIFLMARDQVAGLGQFGVELNGVDPVRHIRRMRIPISEPSIFRDVVQKRTVYKKSLPDNQWNNYLVRNLGGIKPAESFGAPIIAGGKIAAILYGDNVPENKLIGDTDSLEIFLAQAGLAMERAFLERRITELSSRV